MIGGDRCFTYLAGAGTGGKTAFAVMGSRSNFPWNLPMGAGRRNSSLLPPPVPMSTALPGRLPLARSLRPLRRIVKSPIRRVVSIDDSIRRFADSDPAGLVLRPVGERWLSLTLVVDRSVSMRIWSQTARELENVLRATAAFRRIDRMELSADGAEPQFVGGDGARVNERRGGGDESRLILIFSDCVSEAWRSGQVFQCLAAWSRRATVGLLHALPESLWPRTSLGLGRVVRLRRKPGATGHAGFQAEPLNPWIDPPIGGGCLLPVADLRPGALRSLADFVAGGRTECAGILLPESETRLENAGQEPETDPSAEERVHRFKQMASPKAIQLAGLATASPEISLQTMRLIRQSCLPEARQIHEAEFLLGGLVHAQRQDADVPRARDVPLRFHPGVEELLLDDLTGASMIDVLSLMSRHVEQRMGRSLEGFRALLADPSSIDTTVSEESHPFLELAGDRLRRIGGDYARWATVLGRKPTRKEALSPVAVPTGGGPHQVAGISEPEPRPADVRPQTLPTADLPDGDAPVVRPDDMLAAAEEFVVRGQSPRLADCLRLRSGNFETYDPDEVRAWTMVERLILDYLRQSESPRPLSMALFGPPGAGISFATKSVIREAVSLSGKPARWLELNLAQSDSFETLKDLVRCG